MFSHYVRADVAAGLGAIFIIGRVLYFRSYVADPKTRGPGFILSMLPALILVLGGLVGAIMKLY